MPPERPKSILALTAIIVLLTVAGVAVLGILQYDAGADATRHASASDWVAGVASVVIGLLVHGRVLTTLQEWNFGSFSGLVAVYAALAATFGLFGLYWVVIRGLVG